MLRLIWNVSGTPFAVNVLGVVNAGSIAITQALTNTLDTAIKAGLTSSALATELSTLVSLATVTLKDLRSANAPEFVGTAAPVLGTGTGDLLPQQVSLVVTLRTAFSGKHFRGRVYLWGFTEARNTAGGAYIGGPNPVAFVTAIKSALVANSLDLGVLSRPQPTLPVPWAGQITPVSAVVLRDQGWDTQRRRAIAGV